MTTHSPASESLATTLRATIDRLSSVPPEKATTVFKADTRLVENVLTEARIRRFTLSVDEPPALGGTDTAPNPVELVLAALGTCQEIMYAAYAAVLNIELDSLEITATGPLDLRGLFSIADVPSGFEQVQLQTYIRSPETPERIKQLVDIVQGHCPVLDILQRPVEVGNQVTLNDAPLQ